MIKHEKKLLLATLMLGSFLISVPVTQATFREVDVGEICPEDTVLGDDCGMEDGHPTTEGTCQLGVGEIVICTAPESAPTPPVTSVTTGTSDTDKKAAPLEPTLAINIPTVSLSKVKTSDGFVDIPWMADYIVGVYKYAVFVGSVLAAVMLMIGGLQWLTSGGNSERAGAAKKRITNAVVGLVLILGLYTILTTINPDLVAVKPLRIKTVEQDLYTPVEATLAEDIGGGNFPVGSGVTSLNLRDVDVPCLHTNTPVDESFVEPLTRVAEIFGTLIAAEGKTCESTDPLRWRIYGGGTRPPAQTATYYVRRCLFRPRCTTGTGNPWVSGTIVTEGGCKVPASPSLRGLASCPDGVRIGSSAERQILNALSGSLNTNNLRGHAAGLAIDVHCGRGTGDRRGQYVPCHRLVEQAFKDSSLFCRIPNEEWHFELKSNRQMRTCSDNWQIGVITHHETTENYLEICPDGFWKTVQPGRGRNCRSL